VDGRAEQPAIDESPRVVKHRQIEDLDLRLDVELAHLQGEVVDQLRRIFIDDRREIDRAGGERGHVRTVDEAQSALGRATPATSRRELHDHAGTVLADAVLNRGVALGVGGRPPHLVAHVDVDQGRASLERFLRALDLFGRRDRNCGVVLLGRLAPRDGHGDDRRSRHGSRSLPAARGQHPPRRGD